jgi:hypothetical protein
VDLVLAAAVTELLELETAGGRLLVLGRRVVPLLALGALQCDDFPHLNFLPGFRFQGSVLVLPGLLHSASKPFLLIPVP